MSCFWAQLEKKQGSGSHLPSLDLTICESFNSSHIFQSNISICTVSVWEICLISVSQSFFFFSPIMPAPHPRRRSLRDRLVWQECNARRRRRSDHTLSSLRSLDKWIIRAFLRRYKKWEKCKKGGEKCRSLSFLINISPLATSGDNYLALSLALCYTPDAQPSEQVSRQVKGQTVYLMRGGD